jgi:hypothetical protein
MFQVIENDNVIYVIMNEYLLTEHHILMLCYATIKISGVTRSSFVYCIVIILCLIYGIVVLLCSSIYSGSLSFFYFKLDVCGSVHHSTIHKEESNKMQKYVNILLFHIYVKLNMFWATHRPSSGT